MDDRNYFKEEFRRLHERIDGVSQKMTETELKMTERLHSHHITQIEEMNSVKIKLAGITSTFSVVFGFIGAFIKSHFLK
jgi:hypothetical protein